jgi:hypothetical protein
MTDVIVDGRKYDAVDLRGNGGYVVGPERFINHLNLWKSGTYATKGFVPVNKLPILPEHVLIQWTKSKPSSPIDDISPLDDEKKEDFRSIIRRGEIPGFIPKGARNESFFIFINVLKGKGVPADITKQMCLTMAKVVEDPKTFEESVDIDAMIKRIYILQKDSPYDVAVDMINHGFFQMTNYRPLLHYVLLEDNPYLASKNPHDERAMRTLLMKFQKQVHLENGKVKLINPMDVTIRLLGDENRVDSLGFKPNAGQVYTAHDDPGAKRYLNTYQPIHRPEKWEPRYDMIWREFKILVSRIFGEQDSDEYNLGMDYVTWMLQKPDIKPSISPFITSLKRGVGKSLFFNVLIQIFGVNKKGERQARVTKIDEITGRFFDPTGCIVNLVDEVQFPSHKDTRKESVTFWRHLKNLITAETISVEIKGGATHQMPNSAGLMLAGNVGSSFPIEDFDRRLWVIDNNPPLLEKGIVDNLFNLVTGYHIHVDDRRMHVASLRYHLYERKISMDLATVRAPMTDVKRELMLNSMTSLEEWFITYFENSSNLLSKTPIISKSGLIYVLENVRPDFTWPENAEASYREIKRKGLIRPIRTKFNPALSRQFLVPLIKPDGTLGQPDREILYTTQLHGEYDKSDTKDISYLFTQNLHTINEYRSKMRTSLKKEFTESLEVKEG